MKTTLDLPDDLMREVRILAAQEGRKLKDIIAESLRRDLRIGNRAERTSVRDIAPVSVGEVRELSPEDNRGRGNRLEEMLDERGHRY